MKNKDRKKKSKRELLKEMLKKNLKNLTPGLNRKGPASSIRKASA
ncbi:hypothetical protein ACFQPF_08945 [Fictibacillus iocasae]|uniref:Uncharacterized protein n=1 Tax=Fictibacillus iocasae TaxID=2715437 RepID=A0ABW2NRG4_9BACL